MKRRRGSQQKSAYRFPFEPVAYEVEPGDHVYKCLFLLPSDPTLGGAVFEVGSELKVHTRLGQQRHVVVAHVNRKGRSRIGAITLVVKAN